MALSPEELVAVASLGGAAIGALPGIIAAVFSRRSEDKRHNMALNLAPFGRWTLRDKAA